MSAVLHALAPYQVPFLALVTYLVASVVMGSVIAALAALLLRCWRPLDAAARYAVWYAALVAVVLGPLVTTLVVVRTGVATAPPSITAMKADSATRLPSVTIVPERTHASIAISPAVLYGAAGVWLLVVLGGTVRFVAGAFVLGRLKRDALPLSPERREALTLWRSHAGAPHARAVRLCVSDRVEVPVAVGLFDGMVVLPRRVAEEFDPADVDRFVLHELAHLERRDDWTTVAQRLIQTLLFFNPVVHIIARRLDLEREIACDDRVIAATSDARSYAVGLTRMAESTAWPHRGIAAPAIFVTRRQLSVRVEQLLTRERFAAPRLTLAPAGVALAVSLGAIAAIGTFAPAFALSGADGDKQVGLVRRKVMLLQNLGKKTMTIELDSSTALLIPRSAISAQQRHHLNVGFGPPPKLDSLVTDPAIKRQIREFLDPNRRPTR